MTAQSSEDLSRMQRRRRAHIGRRIALFAGITVVVAAVLGGGYYVWQLRQAGDNAAPTKLVVIVESELEDGTTVAGAAAVLSSEAGSISVDPVDTLESADIPGTSYDRLRDALALGGPDLVARLAAGSDEEVGWLLLDEEAWSELADQAGGVRIDLAGATTVFTGEKLFRFASGPQTLSGAETVALLRGSETLSGKGSGAAARAGIASAIAQDAVGDPGTAATMVAQGKAESSEKPQTLSDFLQGADK